MEKIRYDCLFFTEVFSVLLLFEHKLSIVSLSDTHKLLVAHGLSRKDRRV